MLETNNESKQAGHLSPYKSYIFLGGSILITLMVATFTYLEISDLFKYSLQEYVKGIAQTAVLQFDPKELDKIRGKDSVNTRVYQNAVLQLLSLRYQNPTLKFIDIYRKTDEPHLFEYVADADSMHPEIPIDLNLDGIIDDQDALNYPGDIYDGSDVPNFVQNAFTKPDVDPELESHQWGQTLDASAPIFYDNGYAEYVLNVDVDVSEFMRRVHFAFVPFSIFVFILIILLVFLTISIVKIWSSRVNLLQEIDRQKDELLGLVSHQLATPVSSIKWYLEMMQDGDMGKLSEEQKEHVKTMMGIGRNLSDLVGMILDVSRIQLGRVRIEKQELDLKEFFKEILEEVEPKAIERHQKFEVHLPAHWSKAMLDRRYTRMTIENLLTNAIKYTPEKGDVKLTVSIKNGIMHCEVKDTGCGIPKADQDKIFGKMFRASNVRNSVDGNGFGLYIAKGAVEAQGGKIWFESEERQGTVFRIELPIKV